MASGGNADLSHEDLKRLLVAVWEAARGLDLLVQQPIGVEGKTRRGVWLRPHPSDIVPFFVTREGSCFQAQPIGEPDAKDGIVSIQQTGIMKVFPNPDQPEQSIDHRKIWQSVYLWGTDHLPKGEMNNQYRAGLLSIVALANNYLSY